MITSSPVSVSTVPMYSEIERRVVELTFQHLHALKAREGISPSLHLKEGMSVLALALFIQCELSHEDIHVKVDDVRKAICDEALDGLFTFVGEGRERVGLIDWDTIPVRKECECSHCEHPGCGYFG